jgi:hypothetical protein
MEAFLLNYALLVRDLAEVAAEWPTLAEEERGHHRAALLQTWGNRHGLGQLFRAGRLSDAPDVHVAGLDRLLLEQAARMEQGYGLELRELLAIFRWGTPLTKAAQPVRLEVEPALLDRRATALTPGAAEVGSHPVPYVGAAVAHMLSSAQSDHRRLVHRGGLNSPPPVPPGWGEGNVWDRPS